MYKVELSSQAEIRLSEIIDYYTTYESAERTLKVIESFNNSFNKIAQSPLLHKRFHSETFTNLEVKIYSHFKTYHIYL